MLSQEQGPEAIEDFTGTKIALINGDKVLATLRDDDPDIPYAGMWDLPGGAREEGETAFETVAREVKEELDIDISPDEVLWERVYPAVTNPSKKALFMALEISQEQIDAVTLGDEGQEWKMMPIKEFLESDNAVPGMQARLRGYLDSRENP